MADLIDREYLHKALSAFCDVEHGNKHFLAGIKTAREVIGEAPSVDAVKHGHLEHDDDDYWHCSACGNRLLSDEFDEREAYEEIHYCHRCGAHMDLSEKPTGCDGANMTKDVSMDVSEDDDGQD